MAPARYQLNSWTLALHNGSSASILKKQTSIVVLIEKIESSAEWCVQVNHPIAISTPGGRYRISFKARSVQDRRISLSISKNIAPWSAMSKQIQVDLLSSWRDISAVFLVTESETKARIHFDLGQKLGSVEFSDICIEAIGPMPARPEKSFIICTTERSGSTLLSETLARTGVAGVPGEHFLFHKRMTLREQNTNLPEPENAELWRLPPLKYVERVLQVGRTPNGVFGTKMMWFYLRSSLEMLSLLSNSKLKTDRDLLEWFFPNLTMIHLVRRDKVKQAISSYIAQRSDVWADYGGKKEDSIELQQNDAEVGYSFEDIFRIYKYLIRDDGRWAEFFSRQQFIAHKLYYEDLVTSFDTQINDLLHTMQLSQPLIIPNLNSVGTKRQANAASNYLAERFMLELKDRGVKPITSYSIR